MSPSSLKTIVVRKIAYLELLKKSILRSADTNLGFNLLQPLGGFMI